MLSQVTERAQTACCHASEVEYQSEAPEQSEDRGGGQGDDGATPWFQPAPCLDGEGVDLHGDLYQTRFTWGDSESPHVNPM